MGMRLHTFYPRLSAGEHRLKFGEKLKIIWKDVFTNEAAAREADKLPPLGVILLQAN
jgi:hypothetical protein